MTPPPILIRPYRPSDEGLVFRTWLDCVRHQLPWRELLKDGQPREASVDRNEFSAAFHALITRLVERYEVSVACQPGREDQVFGYMVGDPLRRVLIWVYVKNDFRREHVATRLLLAAFGSFDEELEAAWWTAALRHMAPRWNLRRRSIHLCEGR